MGTRSALGCAAVAGLATGLVAGGILLALRGTDWPLFANWGDSGVLIRWADGLVTGQPVPADYPPVVIHLIARLSELTGDSTASALRTIQVVGTAVFGPIAYLSWGLLLAPVWALAVALVAALPLLEPYEPYTTVVLVALVPVLIAFLRVLRHAETLSWPRIVAIGIGTGLAFAVLFCIYSGWFVWSAPGALVAVLFSFPWRSAVLRGLRLLGLTAVAFVTGAAPLVGRRHPAPRPVPKAWRASKRTPSGRPCRSASGSRVSALIRDEKWHRAARAALAQPRMTMRSAASRKNARSSANRRPSAACADDTEAPCLR